MASAAIETEQLRKVYGENVAVRSLTLEVLQGEAFGFLGPNGAGKTTALKILLGLAKPTSGNARIFGKPIGNPALRSHIGFLPEHFRFHEWLTGTEFLSFHGRLYGLSTTVLVQRIAELLDLVGLREFSGKLLRTYSKGMLQRIGLAQALLNQPKIVFLDEPTSGLDPAGRRLVRDIIKNLRDQGTTIFLNSHLLSEVEITCDRVAFIKNGEVLRVDSLKELNRGQLTVTIRGSGINDEVIEGLNRWSSEVKRNHNGLTLQISDEAFLPEITRYLVQQKIDIYSITPDKIALEDLFLQIVGKDAGL
jgi:ABC-2 type transport system ATP-binding protein